MTRQEEIERRMIDRLYTKWPHVFVPLGPGCVTCVHCGGTSGNGLHVPGKAGDSHAK